MNTYAVMRDAMEKEAFLSHLLAGPVGHVLVNAGGRAAHHASNLGEVMAHHGFQLGAGGGAISGGALRSISAIAGPEALVGYRQAHNLGAHLYNLPVAQRALAMKALTAGQLNHPTLAPLRSAPVVGDLLKAIHHDAAGTAPTLQAKGLGARLYSGLVHRLSKSTVGPAETTAGRVLKNIQGAAPMAGMLAADPIGSAAHFSINTSRELLGGSAAGKKVVKNLFQRGVSGAEISPAKQLAADYLLSPSVLDPYRVGRAAKEVGTQGIFSAFGALGSTQLPQIARPVATAPVARPLASVHNLRPIAHLSLPPNAVPQQFAKAAAVLPCAYTAMYDELMKIARAHGGILLKPGETAFPTDEDEPVGKNMDRRRDEVVVRGGLHFTSNAPGGTEDIGASAVRGLV